MGMIDSLRAFFGVSASADELRTGAFPPRLPFTETFVPWMTMNGVSYGISGIDQTLPGSRQEAVEPTFEGYAGRGMKGNGVIFSLIRDRVALFSQAQFQWRDLRTGRMYGNDGLTILERPWYGATSVDLLARAEEDVSLSGNFFVTRRARRLKRLVPDWVDLVYGTNDPDVSAHDLDADFLGLVYYPGGRWKTTGAEFLPREVVAHYAPLPDPLAIGRGMSWITPVVREVMGDDAATLHKLMFYENAGTPNLVVKRQDAPQRQAFNEWREMIESGHTGVANAYKTLYLTNGADATVVGRDMQQLDFKIVQGAGETRLAAASGIHPVVAGLSEGMQGASLNAGNFASARRLTVDKTLWWLWANFCGSMETIVQPPSGSQLWVDASDIPFLREDRKDAAEIQQIKASTIRQYLDAGFTPESAIRAVNGEDPTLLKHTGLYSVQLQPPMPEGPEPEPEPEPEAPADDDE